MSEREAFDLISLGSGPAGQKAAIQAAKSGFRAAVIEREAQVGGACLLSGTIPSKALRELALRYRRMRGSASSLAVTLNGEAPLSALLDGVDRVIAAQDRYLRAHICGEPNGFLALICHAESARVLGVQAVGEGATDLVHLGHAAIEAGASAVQFVDQLFNFPTMTEAYRIAAFDVLKQRAARPAEGAARLPRVAVPGLTDFESEYRRIHCT